jgi:hypothetical protein
MHAAASRHESRAGNQCSHRISTATPVKCHFVPVDLSRAEKKMKKRLAATPLL